MLSRPLGALVALVALLLFSGCIPVRDNPNDPAIAPIADLRVVDLGLLPADECTAAAVISTSAAVGVVSRGHCLALDARNSTDPQDDELRWYFEVPGRPESVFSSTGVLVLTTADRLGFAVGQAIEFAVEARDPGNASSVATATLVLENSAPVPATEPLRILPEGGLPWSPSATYELRFDGSASGDPDGDSIRFEWTMPDGSIQATPVATWTTPSSDSIVQATLRVFDGAGEPDGSRVKVSRAAVATVRIDDEPPVWATDRYLFFAPPRRVSPRAPSRFDAANYVWGMTEVPVASESRVAYVPDPSPYSIVLLDPRTGAELDRQSLGVGWSADLLAATESTVWVFVNDNATRELRRFDVTNDVLSSPTLISLPAPLACGNCDDEPHMVGAPDGSLWVGLREALSTNLPGAQVWRLAPGATSLTPIAVSGGDQFTGLSVRPPPESEVWVVLQESIEASPLGVSPHVIERFALDGTSVGSIDAGDRILQNVLWTGTDEAWIYFFSDSVRHMDMSLLAAGESLADATLVSVPWLNPQTYAAAADPVTGTLVVGAEGERLLVRRTGEHEVATAATIRPWLVDAEGDFWYSSANSLDPDQGLTRTATLDPSGYITGITAYALGFVDPDLSTGGAWMSGIYPTGLRLLSATGEILQVRDRIVRDGVEEDFPLALSVSVAPDSRSAWAVEIGGSNPLHFLDLTTDPMESTEVLSDTNSVASLPLPSITGDPWAWIGFESGADPTVGVLDRDGTYDVKLTMTDAISGAFYAHSLRSDRLCAAWVDGSSNLHVRWLDASGATVVTDMAVVGMNLRGIAVGKSATAPDVCWVALRGACTTVDSTLHLRAWTTGPAPVRTLDVADMGDLTSFMADSEDSLRLTRDANSGVGGCGAGDEAGWMTWLRYTGGSWNLPPPSEPISTSLEIETLQGTPPPP